MKSFLLTQLMVISVGLSGLAFAKREVSGIQSAVPNSSGKYDVTCLNGDKEVASWEDIQEGRVCGGACPKLTPGIEALFLKEEGSFFVLCKDRSWEVATDWMIKKGEVCEKHGHYSGCESGSAADRFSRHMVGCKGKVRFEERQALCAPGWRVCSAKEWIRLSHGEAPTYNYWTNDNLGYKGEEDSCRVSTDLDNYNGCGANPMRVCSGKSDALGNECNWSACGLENTSNQYFGGCYGNTTAGTLCCRD